MKRLLLILLSACALAGVLLVGAVLTGRIQDVPIIDSTIVWSIGIYAGDSPFRLGPPPDIDNPVLTIDDITGFEAGFLADPFMIEEAGSWNLFFEVLNKSTGRGEIALATSPDAMRWTYQGVVLAEDFHLSYPFVFRWQGDHYMTPESYAAGELRLYRAVDFPWTWAHVKTLLPGINVDPTLFEHGGWWWLFVSTNPHGDDTLRLYFAESPLGPWTEHPKSPVVRGDPSRARPAGRVVVVDGTPVRFAQDDFPEFGRRVWAFTIRTLTTTEYVEEAVGDGVVIGPGPQGWNRHGMHHVDAHRLGDGRWIACVDGGRKRWRLAF